MTALLFLALAASSIDASLAARYFQEAKWVSDDDHGALWGRPLYGPMMFVDPETREAVANQNPPFSGFKPQGGVFAGTFPTSIGIANTAYTLDNVRWTVVMWPLPENRAERATLMMHELFHRILDDQQSIEGRPRLAAWIDRVATRPQA